MEDPIKRRERHSRSPLSRERSVRRNSDCEPFFGCKNVRDNFPSIKNPTSTSNYASQNTSFAHLENTQLDISTVQAHSCLPRCCTSTDTDLCTNNTLDHCSTSRMMCEHSGSMSASDDDEMNVDSPDSGYFTTQNSTSGNDFFDENSKSDSFDDISKPLISRTSSLSGDLVEENRLCLVPPPKLESFPPQKETPMLLCKWHACNINFPSNREMHNHISSDHIDLSIKSYCCLWQGCKVYKKPARSVKWLKQHISVHTGEKRLKCFIDGCDASFSSQQGFARHVPSHFREVHLPKAQVPHQTEKRFLVKRRKIKNKKKALANIHDCMDQKTVNVILGSLVKKKAFSVTSQSTSSLPKVMCKRHCSKGFKWHLTSDNTWIRSNAEEDDDFRSGILFFHKPIPRCRKRKVAE
ncbi:uncharacterized protein LOC143447794 isoform X2 [Clavelina lepadiformis]|uniref:uncharacterized protein LOC143447794 isoform X2 n=1 Tax=Clavelina lepadiformis TaxID=159417 RepID=UPI00404334F0